MHAPLIARGFDSRHLHQYRTKRIFQSQKVGRATAERRSREAISLPKRESSIWWEILNLGRTYVERNRPPPLPACAEAPAGRRSGGTLGRGGIPPFRRVLAGTDGIFGEQFHKYSIWQFGI